MWAERWTLSQRFWESSCSQQEGRARFLVDPVKRRRQTMKLDKHVLRSLATPEGAKAPSQARGTNCELPHVAQYAVDIDHLESQRGPKTGPVTCS